MDIGVFACITDHHAGSGLGDGWLGGAHSEERVEGHYSVEPPHTVARHLKTHIPAATIADGGDGGPIHLGPSDQELEVGKDPGNSSLSGFP